MSSVSNGQFVRDHMSPATDIETASLLLGRLEGLEADRRGVSVAAIRGAIARRLHTSSGTLENLRRQRLKSIPNWLMSRIRAELIATLQHQARQLEHEIHLHLQSGADHRDTDLAEAQDRLAQAKAILKNGAERPIA